MSSYLHKKMGHTNEPEGDFEGSIGFLNWIALKFYMAKDYIYPAIEYQINVSPMVLLLEMGAIIFTVVFVYTIYKRVRRLRCSKTIQTQTEDVPTAQANDTPMEGQVPKNHTEDEPMAEDKPKIEGEPIAEDEPMAEDEPKVEDEPMVKDAPMVEDAPMSIEAEV
ncbi:uncharacterized protein [Drosophila bipectinata]|uniref:uncharacterized protein isoform X2 n=1 Tax=Drosophila bipectinata TaxID=42026 RepID=UPI001C88E4BD|nr:uncharacterized protein LOC108121750 [Drosophila bipectinata]